MAGKNRVRLLQVTPREAMSLALAEIAIGAAVELLDGGGYPRLSTGELEKISTAICRAALAVPHLVEDMASTTEEQLETVAQDIGARVVAELFGPALN